MAVHSHTPDSFWKEVTKQLCATILQDPSNYSTNWLTRALDTEDEANQQIKPVPPPGRFVDGIEYANQLIIGWDAEKLTAEVHISHLTSSEDMSERLISPSPLTPLTPMIEKATIAPTSDSPIIHPSNDNIEKLKSSNAASPTPAPDLASGISERATSPSTQSSDITSKAKRKLTFGMPGFGNETRLKMLPPRRPQPSDEEETFSQIINIDAFAPSESEITFKDIGNPLREDLQPNKEIPKPPVLLRFESPLLPVLIGDKAVKSYPKCCDGQFTAIPLFHLEALRKMVDPAFQNDHWGDGLYFSDGLVHSHYYNRSAFFEFERRDWSIVFHSLDVGADHRVPLPDTTTSPHLSVDQIRKILSDWSIWPTTNSQKSIREAEKRHQWTVAQTYKPGTQWSEVRGKYYLEPSEFESRFNQDICASPDFKVFCSSARFFDGRPVFQPNLSDTRSVLKYARQKALRNLDRGEIDPLQAQTVHTSQDHLPATLLAPLENRAAVEPRNLVNATSLRAVATLQQVPQQLHQSSQVIYPDQFTQLVNNAYEEIRIFITLPRESLLEVHRAFFQARAHHFTGLGQPAPNTNPSVLELWNFFRSQIQARAAAAAQASISHGFLPVQYRTPVSNRPFQLQSHVPTTPSNQDTVRSNTQRHMIPAATPLGSPFLTPGRPRNNNIDPRLA